VRFKICKTVSVSVTLPGLPVAKTGTVDPKARQHSKRRMLYKIYYSSYYYFIEHYNFATLLFYVLLLRYTFF